MTNLERRLPATDPGAMEVRSPLDHTANDQRPASGVTPGEQLVKIYAGKLFDPDTLQFLPQRMVTVARNAGLVLDVQPWTAEQLRDVDFEDANTVDLRDATVLPGFVDAHVHRELPSAPHNVRFSRRHTCTDLRGSPNICVSIPPFVRRDVMGGTADEGEPR